MPATVTVLDSTGATQTVNTLPALGQVAKASSLPVALATDDPVVTAIGAQADTAATNGSTGTAMAYLRAMMNAATSTASQPVTIDQTTPGTTNGVVSTPVSTAYALNPAAQAPYRLRTSAASTNAAVIKNSAGVVKWIIGTNNKAGKIYLELYNKTTSPTVGTDTPYMSFELPASAAFAIDLSSTGTKFSTGIAIGLHTVNADNDGTGVASGDITGLNVVFD